MCQFQLIGTLNITNSTRTFSQELKMVMKPLNSQQDEAEILLKAIQYLASPSEKFPISYF